MVFSLVSHYGCLNHGALHTYFLQKKGKANNLKTQTYLQFGTYLSVFGGIGSYKLQLKGSPKHTSLFLLNLSSLLLRQYTCRKCCD